MSKQASKQMSLNCSLTLYFKETAPYSEEIVSIRRMLDIVSLQWGIHYEVIESSKISDEEGELLMNEFRSIQPQIRGRIVTSKGKMLPISKSKRLNLDNTPILEVIRDDRAIDVYPHVLGTHYFSINKFLEHALKFGLENHFQARGLLEEPVVKILSENPEILGAGVKCLGSEIDVGTGVADMLFRDAEGQSIVVEVETNADDFAIGQVSRLAGGYASKHNLDPKTVRKAIICQTSTKNLKEAATGVGIELYHVSLNRIA
jgi:hypothetical protein